MSHIEDTDATHDSEKPFNQITDSLTQLGLDWDEGVGKGGPYGPYRQFERIDIYCEVAGQLLKTGYAYESSSTPGEVQTRHVVTRCNPKLGYDGPDRDMTTAQREEYIRQGCKPVSRLRMPDEDTIFTDLAREGITFKAGSAPNHMVVRTNRDPLYPLVSPIDDALTETTHILCGEDISSSTPRQVVLYHAFYVLGIAKLVSYFEHLPYVVGEGNKKLSKHDPGSNPLSYRQYGIILGGLVSYLALLGWSIASDRDIFGLSEMAAVFDVKDVNPSPVHFNQRKCDATNAEHTRLLDTDDFMRCLVPLLAEIGAVSGDNFEALTTEEQYLVTAATPLAQTRVVQLNQITDLIGLLFSSGVSYNDKAMGKPEDPAPMTLSGATGALEAAAAGVWGDTEAIHQALNEALIDGLGSEPCEVFVPLFVVVTGINVSIPVFDLIQILGREKTLYHLASFCVKYCAPNGSQICS